MKDAYKAGFDIGSTTVKAVVCDHTQKVIFSRYRRHRALTVEAVRTVLDEARAELGDIEVDLCLTGSGGIGIAETYDLPFFQEVVASSRLVRHQWPGVRTFIEVGGEDSKVIFFDEGQRPDIRMNGTCAGGTGAFIDQIATILGVSVEEMDRLSRQSKTVYPMASRCGVFAKTDVQMLLANHAAREDVAASVFHSVALQVVATLFKGREAKGKLLFAGGPLGFFPGLRRAFLEVLDADEDRDLVRSARPELIAATGAALYHDGRRVISLSACIERLGRKTAARADTKSLPPLFGTDEEFISWRRRHERHRVGRTDLGRLDGEPCFLGIDSGSTTTKMVLMDGDGRIALSHYGSNNGDPVRAVKTGLASMQSRIEEAGVPVAVARSAATGYGEDLVRAAFGLDDGVVETVAHFRAAKAFSPEVSFVLDIGGQDMKAIFLNNGTITDIQINEACSSGCGSFIETLARSLGYDVKTFASLACRSISPFDLGTRCTVFMNSRIKEAQRQGASIEDISAGLAYAVVKNSLHKVLKLHDANLLGERIMVHGGAFRNPAVLRALELLTGKEVVRPDAAELMGAYGAAIVARENHRAANHGKSAFVGFGTARRSDISNRETVNCRGCENACRVKRLTFTNGRRYFTGNRCERTFSNNGDGKPRGTNMAADKARMLFDRPCDPEGVPILSFGIPRALNMYEDFPFWAAFLTACGFRVVLSSPSGARLFEKGVHTVMSDNICFPGKLVHGHIRDLVEKKVDRIFYPNVVYEQKECTFSWNSYNCPVVTGYPDIIRSAVNPADAYSIPLDSPTISFKDPVLLEKQVYAFVRRFGVTRAVCASAARQARKAQNIFRARIKERGEAALKEASAKGVPIVVLAGRPYHLDPFINHGIPELLAGLGVCVVVEDALPFNPQEALKESDILTQWEYPNRILAAAEYVSSRDRMDMALLTSFGCGIDAVAADEARLILSRKGRSLTVIKIDEIANLGAARIRLRSLVETFRHRAQPTPPVPERANPSPRHGRAVKPTILIPWISPMYSPLLPPLGRALGLDVEILPPPDRDSVERGLKYVNNDVCYPAAVIIGDIVKALDSGRYDPERTATLYAQTYGQCRASNYLPLIRKALKSAGYDAVEAFSLSLGEGDGRAGLEIDKRKTIRRLALGVVFADALARLYHATAPHALCKEEAARVHKEYLDKVARLASEGARQKLFETLSLAVDRFNSIATHKQPVARVVGVVGEIYVTYNAFGGAYVVDWFISQGAEVVVPPLFPFFAQTFVNQRFDYNSYLARSFRDLLLSAALEIYTNRFLSRVEAVMKGFYRYREYPSLRSLSKEAAQIVSFANQAGEGWLLAAEMIAMYQSGVKDLICMQPFGCLANHVTGKGISQRMKKFYPEVDLLFLDMDAGQSEVNILNRLHSVYGARG
ncbi:MAG: Activator of (R)-2-hydroxyglutaryl-CoA dehydratase [Syntrophorhabdus sp. PtaB.Bin184]|nr:MAG: Activator of (R)-2-hydroxyglutaryl-CoA dehydratase [Syntrophorhabdus sp. PtaB.Bin184]